MEISALDITECESRCCGGVGGKTTLKRGGKYFGERWRAELIWEIECVAIQAAGFLDEFFAEGGIGSDFGGL